MTKGGKSDIIYNETKNALFRRGCGIEEKSGTKEKKDKTRKED